MWRVDLDAFEIAENLTKEVLNSELQKVTELATTIPIQPQERATLATFRAEALLKLLAKKSPEKIMVVIDPGGEETAYSLREIAGNAKFFERENIAFSTIILPCQISGLDGDGNPLDKLSREDKAVKDVVHDEWTRYKIDRQSSNSFLVTRLKIENAETKEFTSLRKALNEFKDKGVCQNWKELQKAFANEDEKTFSIAYFIKRSQVDDYLSENADDTNSLDLIKTRTVSEHDADVEKYARIIAEKIGLPNEFIDLLAAAGFRHDLGKNREWWQKAIGNVEGCITNPLAKSKNNYFDHSFNQYYRHEFGSLVETLEETEIENHPHRDLILHLIAAHHGYARPHFPERAFDRNQPKPVNQAIAHEVMLRFNSLQRKYGWWQLAYLEAVLKAADALASRDFSQGQLGGNS